MNFNHNLWGKIVPDGPRFCHWGGKNMSKKLSELMVINSKDRILDLCCGQGGTTDYLGQARFVVGIDISKNAIEIAQKTAKNPRVLFLTANARSLPFSDNSFNKIICQDADAWMYKDKKSLMKEAYRILCPNGMFIWQSYATNENPIQKRTRKVLKNVGYIFNELPLVSDIKSMFTQTGFSIIKFQSIHKIYSADNIRMLKKSMGIKKLNKNKRNAKDIRHLIELLQWEKILFKKNLFPL